jgi:hypothetical protein
VSPGARPLHGEGGAADSRALPVVGPSSCASTGLGRRPRRSRSRDRLRQRRPGRREAPPFLNATVTPEYRRGVATAVVDLAIESARERGWRGASVGQRPGELYLVPASSPDPRRAPSPARTELRCLGLAPSRSDEESEPRRSRPRREGIRRGRAERRSAVLVRTGTGTDGLESEPPGERRTRAPAGFDLRARPGAVRTA